MEKYGRCAGGELSSEMLDSGWLFLLSFVWRTGRRGSPTMAALAQVPRVTVDGDRIGKKICKGAADGRYVAE